MPTFYDVDLRRASMREFAFGTPWYRLPLIALMKFFQASIPASTDDPPAESLQPFEVDEAALPDDIRAQFAPLAQELAALGFHSPLYHAVDDTMRATKIYWATYLHSSGQAWARIHCRIWSVGRMTTLFPMIFTAFDDGSFLVTSGGKPDMLMPDSIHMVNVIGATPTQVWERHLREQQDLLPRAPRPIQDHHALRIVMEQYHAQIRDYLLRRGIFRPLSDTEQQQLAGQAVPTAEASAAKPEDTAVLIQLTRLQNQQSSVWTTLLILAVSIVLFVAAMRTDNAWNIGWLNLTWMLIPILAFHELGHFLVMRWFGYRNLKMFFIPFFGAAVTGRHYNIAGWKKAMVALAGPVPGILLAAVLGAMALFFHQSQLAAAALLMVFLNAFQLLPLFPLDGGWVVHAVLFVRNPLLDVGFRLVAIAGLFGLGYAAGDKIIMGLAVIMLIGVPVQWRLASVAHRLRRQGDIAASPDGYSIPPAAALTILGELRTALPRQTEPKLLAQMVGNVFETLNARPPGVWASLGLLAVQGMSFLASIVLAVILFIGQRGDFWEMADMLARKPTHLYVPGDTQAWHGPEAPAAPNDSLVTIIATFDSKAAAKAMFDELPAELPRHASLRWFGESVLLTLPDGDKQEREFWRDRLRLRAKEVIVHRKDVHAPARLFAIVPDPQAAERLETELREYFDSPNSYLLMPPWTSGWQALSGEQHAAFEKARRTAQRLRNLRGEATKHPDIRARQKSVEQGMRTGDHKAITDAAKALDEAIKAEENRLLEAIRTGGDPGVDLGIVALWDELRKLDAPALFDEDSKKADSAAGADDKPANPPDPEALKARFEEQVKIRKDIDRRMAVRMGALPTAKENAVSPDAAQAVRFGHVRRHGLYLFFEVLDGPHPDQALPALADWLSARGCTEIRYGFVSPFGPGDDDPAVPDANQPG